MMTEELKPCPFCGKKVAIVTNCVEIEGCENFESCANCGWKCVVCNAIDGGCGASGGYADSEEKAITKWNTRASDENPPLTLDELRQMEGKPVWVVDMIPKYNNGWYALVSQLDTTFFAQAINSTKWGKDYGKTWVAYRRKPEEARE